MEDNWLLLHPRNANEASFPAGLSANQQTDGRLDCQLFVCLSRFFHQNRRDYLAQTTDECPGQLSSSVLFLFPSPLPCLRCWGYSRTQSAPDSQPLFHRCPPSSCLSRCLVQLRSRRNTYANMGSLIGVCAQMIYAFFAFFPDFCIFTTLNCRSDSKLESVNLLFSLHLFYPSAFITRGCSHLAGCFPAESKQNPVFHEESILLLLNTPA